MKKTIAILLVMLLLVSVFAGCSNNASTNDPANTQTENTEPPRQTAQTAHHKAAESFAGGTGTAEDPFQISEAGHLVLLHEMLKKEEAETNFDDTYVKGYYILTADIALNDTADFANWNTTAPEYGWEPIGVVGAYFSGVLDGNGHKITGMFIDADSANKSNYGLFSELRGTVKNLTVEDSYICVSGNPAQVGTVAGYTYDAVIENCSADTDIALYGPATAGGIVAQGTTVTNCTFSGAVVQLDNDVSIIGGIAGTIGSDIAGTIGSRITGCTFSGTLSGNGHTGGILGFGENVANCINKGSVSGDVAGGIVGRAYCVGTNLEIKITSYAIENCTNEGSVTGVTLAGGIVGWMSDDEPDISLSVIACENKGQVICDEAVAGIIGKLSVERSGNIKIENCVNNADISGKGNTGGIICDLHGGILHQAGNVVVSGCKNLGDIISEDQCSAGIITYLLVMGDEVDLALTLDNCSNEGAVKSTKYAGGILGFSNVGFNAEVSAEGMNFSDSTKIVLNKCNNAGNVTTTSSNSMAGGIVGVLGLGYIPTEIKDCVNSGNVAIDFTLTDEQISGFQDAEWTEIYQIGGGVVGRIGSALKLTTSQEEAETSADNVNATEGKIVISGCKSTGTISAPDYSYILNKWGMPLFVNYLGGIVGQCSATDGYAFAIENCTYSGAERGLGITDYADVGTKK